MRLSSRPAWSWSGREAHERQSARLLVVVSSSSMPFFIVLWIMLYTIFTVSRLRLACWYLIARVCVGASVAKVLSRTISNRTSTY